jgi:hypothetical protein
MRFKKEADRELSRVNPAAEARKPFRRIYAQLPYTLFSIVSFLRHQKKCEIGSIFHVNIKILLTGECGVDLRSRKLAQISKDRTISEAWIW